MDDAGPVSGSQSLGDLRAEYEGSRQRHCRVYRVAKGLALEQFLHHVVRSLLFTDIEYRGDMRVI